MAIRFVAAVLLLAPFAFAGEAKKLLTARQVIESIQKHAGASLPPETVDTIKAGDPNTPVTGIAVTMMATYEVLEKAAQSNLNLVITHEPLFYNHLDKTDALDGQNDQVLKGKEAFIRDHHMVVWRFHDGWHRRTPDGIRAGMVKALGWEKFSQGPDSPLYSMPEVRLETLASDIKAKLGIRVLRVVGDPQMKVTQIALMPGAAGPARQIKILEQQSVEVLAIGEVPEWETIEYVADAIAQGRRKSLLLLGHIPSEQAGMKECSEWLTGIFPDIPIAFTPAKEPFWEAAAPPASTSTGGKQGKN